jgi:hypothetical protein
MKERKAVAKATAERYLGAGKKEKGRILDEFTLLTGYNRSYARHVLRESVEGRGPRESVKRKKVYDESVLAVLPDRDAKFLGKVNSSGHLERGVICGNGSIQVFFVVGR